MGALSCPGLGGSLPRTVWRVQWVLKKGDFSKKALQAYEKMWRDRMEDKLIRNWMAKEKFATLDDKTLDELITLIKDSDIGEVNVFNLLKVVKEKYPQVVEGFEDLI